MRHFLASIMPNHQYLRTSVVFSENSSESETFVWTGNQMLKPGFTTVFPWREAESQNLFPTGIKGIALIYLMLD